MKKAPCANCHKAIELSSSGGSGLKVYGNGEKCTEALEKIKNLLRQISSKSFKYQQGVRSTTYFDFSTNPFYV